MLYLCSKNLVEIPNICYKLWNLLENPIKSRQLKIIQFKKKLFLLSVMALGAMTMNAELNLQYVGTINAPFYISDGIAYGLQYGEYSVTNEFVGSNTVYHIYSFQTCTNIKNVTLITPQVPNLYMRASFISDDFWTNDGNICFIVDETEGLPYPEKLYNEDGELLKTFKGSVGVVRGKNCYYVIDNVDIETDVYKILINNTPADTTTPSV